MLKKDSVVLGLLMGAALPWLLYGIVQLVFVLMDRGENNLIEAVGIPFIACNAFLLRYWIVKKSKEQVGKGIMAITFAYVIAYVCVYLMETT